MSTLTIISLITFYAGVYNINPAVAIAVAEQESKLDPNAVGALNEQGLFQLRPEFNSEYTIEQLRQPEINIKLGLAYLAKMQKECKHKGDLEFLTCFNLGPSAAKKIKFPGLFPYVLDIKRKLANKEN